MSALYAAAIVTAAQLGDWWLVGTMPNPWLWGLLFFPWWALISFYRHPR